MNANKNRLPKSVYPYHLYHLSHQDHKDTLKSFQKESREAVRRSQEEAMSAGFLLCHRVWPFITDINTFAFRHGRMTACKIVYFKHTEPFVVL